MSNRFKNAIVSSVGTASSVIYTAPANTSATIIGMSIANRTGEYIRPSVSLFDSSVNTFVYMVKSVPIPVGSSIIIVGGEQKIVLEANDYILVVSDVANSADVIMSVLEIT
jgi:hypothetical protein